MPPGAWLANYRHYLERLLLSVEELSDPHWEPDTSIDVFLQARGPPVDIPSSEREELRLLALRLAGTVRFLSRVRVYRGLVETAPTLPLLLQDAPGISLENYRVPGCAANMMSIIMVLLGRLCDVEDRDRQAISICSPILQEFRATAMAAARLDHTDTEYPQFHRNGLLQELFYEIDLVPEERMSVGLRMVDFPHHPFMARVSREILEPLYQFFLRIREDFTWSPETKTKGEKHVMRQRVRDYLEMAGRLSDYVIRHHDLAEAKRIPTPRVAWLQVVMRADSVYGFEGDDNQLLRVILRGKIASLLQYSERLRQHAVDHIVERDDEGTRTQRAFNPKSENPFYGLPGVIEEGEVEAMETLASTKFAHVEYVREHLRPFCELIRGCIPSAVTVPDDLPDGRAEFLRPYVGAYLEKAAFLYSAALEYAKSNIEAPFLDPSVIWSLTMARTFHYMIGQPTYGYSRECCDAFLGRISSALSFADRTRTSASHTDVPLSVEIASLPHVPSWTRDRINHLCILELNDAWTCENALLQDEIEASQGIGRGLEKAVAQAEAGYGQNPSGRRHSTARRFSKEELVILWIHRSHHLAQQLHRTTHAAPVAETPEATVGLIRDAVSVLLKNMVALGKASVTYGKHAEGEEPAFFVPSEGTTLFGMAERFVDLYGFHEDSSLLDHAILFENLCTLQEAMIRNPGYLELGIDFPNFDLSSTELEWYGIFPSTRRARSPFFQRLISAVGNLEGSSFDTTLSWGKKEGIRSPIFRWRDCPHVLTHPNRWRNRKSWIGRSTRSGLGAAMGRILMREWTGVVVGELYYGWNVKSSRILPLVAHRIPPQECPNSLFVVRTVLQSAILETPISSGIVPPFGNTGHARLHPDEPWSEFFEFRLRPMVYLVHAGVTQDFSLIGRKGVYSLGELEEISIGYTKLFSTALLLVCRKALQPVYEDDFSISCPPTWGIPGEAVAMFEIMYRICLSIGFPCSDDSLCPLDRHVLLPLIMGARETRALLKTADDYSAYNRFGEVIDADRFIGGLARIIKQERGRASASDSESSSPLGICERRAKIGIGVFFLVCEFVLVRRRPSRVERFVGSYVESAADRSLTTISWIQPTFLAPSPKSPKKQDPETPVDAMDVDERRRPPLKRRIVLNKGSAVSNAAESSSKPVERPAPLARQRRPPSLSPSPRLALAVPVARLHPLPLLGPESSVDGISRMYEFYTRDAEEIGKEYKKVEARDPDGFFRTVEYFSREGLVEPLDALRPTLTIPSSSTLTTRSPAGNGTPATFSSLRRRAARFNGSVRGRVEQVQVGVGETRRVRVGEGDRVSGEAKGEAFGVEGARALSREDPATHQYQSSRVLTYIEERKRAVAEFETRLNLLGCYILFRVRAQFEGEPLRVAAAPPPRQRQFLVRGARRCQLNLISPSSSRGRILGRTTSLVGPAQVQGKKKAVVASRESRESEPEVDPEIITCTVKVKKGKRQSAVELTGPKNEYDSQLWHDRNDLFGCVRCLLADNECVRPRYGDETPTAACTHCRADNTTCELSPVEFDWEMTDAALPDVNAEWMELQLAHARDRGRGRGWDHRALARALHAPPPLYGNRPTFSRRVPSLEREFQRRGGKSGTAHWYGGRRREGRRGWGRVDGSGQGFAATSLRSRRARAFQGDRLPRPSIRLTMDSVEIPSRTAILDACFPNAAAPIVRVAASLQSPLSRPSFSSGRRLTRSLPSTSIFGKAGVLLGSKPNETSEGLRAASLEEGEIDAEGDRGWNFRG
ncbi:hypothetical protein B0H13DRAFT_1915840 [Mycena leptocephala]|nr:hypothetical protein B0H13DRAFT_1915840 [Mycena leptocephala]